MSTSKKQAEAHNAEIELESKQLKLAVTGIFSGSCLIITGVYGMNDEKVVLSGVITAAGGVSMFGGLLAAVLGRKYKTINQVEVDAAVSDVEQQPLLDGIAQAANARLDE